MLSRKQTLLLIAMLLSAITLCSCATAPIMAERPKEEVFRTELKKDLSTLNMPIEVSAYELAGVLNRSIREEIYKGSTTTSGLTADVTRNGGITVSAADNYLYITLPIKMLLSYRMFETPVIPLKLKFKVSAGITRDWRLHTEIYYIGLSDLLLDEVGVGFVTFSPRKIAEGITQPVQNMLSGLIEEKINNMFPLKSRIASVWNLSQKPLLLDKSFNAWLKLTPTDVMFYPLYAQNNMVRLSVGISTFAELVVGPEPAPRQPLPLPNLKLVNSFDRTFRIALNADLFYKDLRAIGASQLLDKPFSSDGKTIVIKDLELYGNGDKLVVKLQTEGSLAGVFYLTAKPVFDPKTNIFSVEDVDFDMQTQSLLLKSGDWFLHGAIRGMLQEKLNMNLSEQMEQSRQVAAKALARVELKDNVFLKGNIKKLKFSDMIVQKDKISIQVYTEGESAVVFQ